MAEGHASFTFFAEAITNICDLAPEVRYALLMCDFGGLLLEDVLLDVIQQLSVDGDQVAQLLLLELQHLLAVGYFLVCPPPLPQHHTQLLHLPIQLPNLLLPLLHLLSYAFQLLLHLCLHFYCQSATLSHLLTLLRLTSPLFKLCILTRLGFFTLQPAWPSQLLLKSGQKREGRWGAEGEGDWGWERVDFIGEGMGRGVRSGHF